MSFQYAGEYLDLRKVDARQLLKESETNPHAALVIGFIHSVGLNHSLPINQARAKKVVEPFIRTDPYCAAFYCNVHINEAPAIARRVRHTEVDKILKPFIGQLLGMAAKDDFLALIFLGRMYIAAIGFPYSNLNRSNECLQRAMQISSAHTDNGLPDGFSSYHASVFTRAILRERRAGAQSKAAASGGSSEEYYQLTLKGADYGIAQAQLEIARFFYSYLDENKPAPCSLVMEKNGDAEVMKSDDEILSLAKHYFLLAAKQGLVDAKTQLAQIHESREEHREAEALYRELSDDDLGEGHWRLANILEKQGKFADAIALFDRAGARNRPDGFVRSAEIYFEGRPGLKKDRTKALRACISATKASVALSNDARRSLTAMLENLRAAAWANDPQTGLRRINEKDDLPETGLIVLDEDPVMALSVLQGEAAKIERANEAAANGEERKISLDLALALAERDGAPTDEAESYKWHRYAANHYNHVPSRIETAVRSFKGRPGVPRDWDEALRQCDALMPERGPRPSLRGVDRREIEKIKNTVLDERQRTTPVIDEPAGDTIAPQQPLETPQPEPEPDKEAAAPAPARLTILQLAENYYRGAADQPQDLVEALRWCQLGLSEPESAEQAAALEKIQDSILSPPEVQDPRVWVREKRYVVRPANMNDEPDTLEIVPPDTFEATRWYQDAAEQGSLSAALVLAKRCEAGRGIEKNLTNAFHLCSQIEEAMNDHSEELPTKATKDEFDEFKESLLKQAWIQSAEENTEPGGTKLNRYRHSVDLDEVPSHVEEIQFLPGDDEVALEILRTSQDQSNDVKIAYAWNLARGIGCPQPRQAEAFAILTQAMIFLENMGRGHVLSEDFPGANEIYHEWHRADQVVTAERIGTTNNLRYSVKGNPADSYIAEYSRNMSESVRLFISRQERQFRIKAGIG